MYLSVCRNVSVVPSAKLESIQGRTLAIMPKAPIMSQ
jgi:hypothetical protein